MRKIVAVLILVFAFTLTSEAQRRIKRMQKDPMTVEQQTTLAIKKMTLALDLSEAQQKQIKPIIQKQIEERKTQREAIKKRMEEKKRMEAKERFEHQNKMLDKKIEMKNKMKSILNKEQFEKFEKMAKRRERGKRQKMEKMVKMRKMKEWKKKKELEKDDN